MWHNASVSVSLYMMLLVQHSYSTATVETHCMMPRWEDPTLTPKHKLSCIKQSEQRNKKKKKGQSEHLLQSAPTLIQQLTAATVHPEAQRFISILQRASTQVTPTSSVIQRRVKAHGTHILRRTAVCGCLRCSTSFLYSCRLPADDGWNWITL